MRGFGVAGAGEVARDFLETVVSKGILGVGDMM